MTLITLTLLSVTASAQIIGLDTDSDSSNYNYQILHEQSGFRPFGIGSAMAPPTRKQTVQSHNNLQMTLTNAGAFAYATYYWSNVTRDPFTGEKFATVHYPKGMNIRYQMNGTMFLGAIVDGDTLVSIGINEMHADHGISGDFTYRSFDHNSTKYDPEANSQLDILTEFTDTFLVYAQPDIRAHKPLGLKIEQKSMSWTGDNLDDFIIIEYKMFNIGGNYLKDMYVGFRAHGGVNYHAEFDYTLTQIDDVVGFIGDYPAPEGCHFVDRLNIAYQMDNDGDPLGRSWAHYSPRAAVGMRILSVPSDDWDVNYNWSAELGFAGPRYSPRKKPIPGKPYRNNLPHLMMGLNDAELYYYMSNREVDYHQLDVANDHSLLGWIPPPKELTNRFTTNSRPYYMVSAGPFDLQPGEVQSIVLAVVGGENVHVNPLDYARLYKVDRVQRYLDALNFDELAMNARWAGWIYDNPGVDTDGDGYRGEFRVCESDTNWYKGDGVADLKADGPPQSPVVRVIPTEASLIIRWNGYRSETPKDIFTGIKDFEGYRVYAGLDDRRSSLSVLAVYDRENYNRFHIEEISDGIFDWVNNENPFTLDSLRIEYRDQSFRPGLYTKLNPLHVGDSLYYFEKHSYNVSDLCCEGEIHKVYPNATDPGTDSSLWTEDDVTMEHGEPLPKFYEYQYIYDDLLPTLPYWVAVSAFDFGFAAGKIPSKESDPTNNMTMELPQTSADTVAFYNLDVYVYPNPWRWDANYGKRGYQNRDGLEIKSRSNRIHFSNLPKVCKIYIYSLDGDLVREFVHDFPDGGPASMHDTWDMITRNTQAVVSGLYYWVVESDKRTQMGKLVILK